MSNIAVQAGRAVARPLSALVPLIKDDLKQAERAGMPFYVAAGEKMLEAKAQCRQGEFSPWVKRNFDIGMSQAQHYMQLASATTDIQKPAAEFSSVKDFRRRHLGHDLPTSGGGLKQPEWREGVKETVERARADAKRLNDESLSRQQERDAERKLALRLIDIGFRILVKELHPDKGGSRDATMRLNRVRDRLKQHA